jgi:hypothetical protein
MGGSIQPRSPLKFALAIFVVRRIGTYVEVFSDGAPILLRRFFDAVKFGKPVRTNLIAEPFENPANVVPRRREIVE